VKLKPFSNEDRSTEGFSFFCPGCGHGHVYYTKGSLAWSFNGNVDSPTFTPSLLNTCPNHPDPKQRVCHLFLTDGKLAYCGDCTHDLAGKTIELPEHSW
jgi:hypothetical protein